MSLHQRFCLWPRDSRFENQVRPGRSPCDREVVDDMAWRFLILQCNCKAVSAPSLVLIECSTSLLQYVQSMFQEMTLETFCSFLIYSKATEPSTAHHSMFSNISVKRFDSSALKESSSSWCCIGGTACQPNKRMVNNGFSRRLHTN